MRDLIRTRWAAVGAAVAITLGAGGVSLTQAALTTDPKPVYVSLSSPCRVLDTRSGSPISAGDAGARTVQITGSNGDCKDALAIPADAVGVSTNVTVIQPSGAASGRSFFTVYPEGATRPTTSNLNFVNGQAPTPNKVDVGIGTDGKIKIYNNEGTAHAAVDIFGYYIDHDHNGADIVDESLTGADIQNNTVSNADTSNEPGVASDFVDDVVSATSTPAAIAGTAIRVPSDGQVVVEVTGNWTAFDGAATDTVYCQLQKGAAAAIDFTAPWFRLDDAGGTWSGFSAHRVLPIAVADNPLFIQSGQGLSLVCDEQDGDVRFDDIHVSATFYATSYEPIGFIFTPFSTTASAGAED